MKLFIVALVASAALAMPDKLPSRARQQKQVGSFYGSPSNSDPIVSNYGSPSEPSLQTYGAAADSSNVVESLAGYGDSGLDAQASDLDEVSADPLSMLMKSVPGLPGEDYPIYSEVPETAFVCDGKVNGGYYADDEAQCQVFHICAAAAEGDLTKYSFLCPNGTIFNQEYFICDWWFNVDCSEAAQLADARNADLENARSEADARLAESASLDTAASAPIGSYGVSDLDNSASAPAASSYRGALEGSASAPIGSSYGAALDGAASAPIGSSYGAALDGAASAPIGSSYAAALDGAASAPIGSSYRAALEPSASENFPEYSDAPLPSYSGRGRF